MPQKFTIGRLAINLLACALTGFACASCNREDRVDEMVRSHMSAHNIPGIAIAVVRDGQVIKAQGYGVANREDRSAVDSQTVFPIQSITKQFTATAILMLVEEGKLGVDDPISRYLDGTPPAWKGITIRHLLTHTSGIKDFINEPNLDLSQDHTEAQIMLSAVDRPLNFEPGDSWAYSNTNYHLLAMTIRRVTGTWYGDFLAKRIFKPLGMTRTWVIRDKDNATNVARGYVWENGQHRAATILPPGIAGYGGGGIQSTVLDLAKWDAALYTERLLQRSTLEQMWTPVRLNNGSSHGYGFGWEIATVNGHRLIWHAGGWTGYSAQIGRLVDDRLTVIVLTNLRAGGPGALARSIAAVHLPDVAARDDKPIPDDQPQLTARLQDVVRRTAEGSLQANDFAPQAWTALAPYLDQLRRDLSSFGPIQKFTLVERSAPRDGVRKYRYQVQFRRTTLIFQFTVGQDGTISGMMPEPPTQ